MISETELREILVEHVDRAAATIPSTTSLIDTGMLDSMAFVTLVACLEERLSLRFDEEDLTPEKFESIEAILGFLSGAAARLHHIESATLDAGL